MADEEKEVEEEVKEEVREAKEEPIQKEDIEEKPQFDSSAIEELKAKMAEFEEGSKQDKIKLDSVKKVLLGEDLSADEEKKFYDKLATKPKEALEELIKKNIEPINKKFKEQEIASKDAASFNYLRSIYSDFDDVIKEAGKYLSKEDIEQTDNLPNRTEIRFNLIRGRRELDLKGRKMQETTAMNKAKEEINKTAKTEAPKGGGTMEEGNVEDELSEGIKSRIREGKWNKGEGFTKQDEDIFAEFNRDAYGIKKK